MPITKHEGATLSNQSLVAEECCLINCVLKNCHLFYSGGDFEMVNCRMENCHWHFRGAAQKTIQLQQTIGMLKPVPIPAPMQPTNSSKMN